MFEKLKSRKFWFALIGALMPILMQIMTGEVTWEVALTGSVAVIMSYILGQGYVDGKEAGAVVTETKVIGTVADLIEAADQSDA